VEETTVYVVTAWHEDRLGGLHQFVSSAHVHKSEATSAAQRLLGGAVTEVTIEK
jgi:hypothetical protein